MVGCGFASLHVNLRPALDKKNKKLVAIDVNAPLPNKQDYVLYSDRTLNRKPFFIFIRSIIDGGKKYPLFSKYNFCPKCEKYELSCEESGCWD